MSTPLFQRIGVVANLEKAEARTVLSEVVPTLLEAGFDVGVDTPLHDAIPAISGATRGLPERPDLFIAVGGDGTILKYAREFVDTRVPILGLKGGRLGFLAEGRTASVARWLREGRYHVQERMRIRAEVWNGSSVRREFTALNDVVVHAAGFSRMVTLRAEVDGAHLRDYAADGLIVATPTGSTAYSLSAGGPLVDPLIQALILTPLNPHALSVRPLVFEAHKLVTVSVQARPSKIVVTVDGQDGCDVDDGEIVTIARSELPTPLVVPEDYDFFVLLREKL